MRRYTDGKKQIEAELAQLKKHCSVIRVLAHTQVCSPHMVMLSCSNCGS